jgi:hypothetical protein
MSAGLTSDQIELYRLAVAEKICAFCNDRDGRHGCARPSYDACALRTHLDLVVESILGVGERTEVAPYVAALRAKTCTRCRQDDDGDCALRDLGQCAVDSYVLPVIEVIEDVARAHGHGKWSRRIA